MDGFCEGIFFNMPEEDYHSVPALSASGMKELRKSPLDFWIRSPMNPRQDEVLAEIGGDSEARAIGRAFHKRIVEGAEVFHDSYAPKLESESCPNALRTQDDLKAWLKERDLPCSGKKEDQIARILEADPDAQIWDRIAAYHLQVHAGKTLLSQKWLDKIEIAAAMIEKHPHLSKAFTGGASEVSIFWACPVIGVNCKARLDYLKSRAVIDLKTLENTRNVPLSRAVAVELGARRYHIQAAFYIEAAAQVARLLRETHEWSCDPKLEQALLADHPKTFLFVWQVKGVAPAALGRTFPPQSSIFQSAQAEIESMKQTYRACLEKYGTDPWVEDSQIESYQDDDVPPWSLI